MVGWLDSPFPFCIHSSFFSFLALASCKYCEIRESYHADMWWIFSQLNWSLQRCALQSKITGLGGYFKLKVKVLIVTKVAVPWYIQLYAEQITWSTAGYDHNMLQVLKENIL